MIITGWVIERFFKKNPEKGIEKLEETHKRTNKIILKQTQTEIVVHILLRSE